MRAEEAALSNSDARSNMLIDVHDASTVVAPRERAELGQSLLFIDRAPRPAREGDFRAFYARLNDFSGGLVEELKGIPDLVFAGGSVTAALVGGALVTSTCSLRAPQRKGKRASATSMRRCSGCT